MFLTRSEYGEFLLSPAYPYRLTRIETVVSIPFRPRVVYSKVHKLHLFTKSNLTEP
jgi:hypothetical protein